jgi:catechol 2,3-dioxygenase-like lactoylglutathione lyase family enzyme
VGFDYRFSHLVLRVADLERSAGWYRDILGLAFLGWDLTAEERRHAVLQMNSGQLVILVQAEPGEVVRPGTSSVHHAFEYTPSQYRRLIARLQQRGYSVEDNRAQFRANGEYSTDVWDPDGHRFQLQTHAPEATEVIVPGAGFIDCGPAEAYAIGEVKSFAKGDFFLSRLPEGFLAMSRWCMHINGKVIYQKEHWRFWCPYHGASYDRRGNPTDETKPDLCALRLHPLSFSAEGHVLVNTDTVIERRCYTPDQAVQPPPVVSYAP